MPQASKLIAMDVAARVVNATTAVPLLTDDPFAATGVLEPGIHLHWALPDALTKATTGKDQPPRFRGVPDLWLVVRFNPVSGNAPRLYRSWVVDSVRQTAIALEQWEPPTDRSASEIHTAPGLLHRVKPGWGEWDMAEPFDALATAYYPACRGRFGFYDDLTDLGGTGPGKVSYTVVGWYSDIDSDSFFHEKIRRSDKLGHRTGPKSYTQLSTAVTTAASAVSWNPNTSSKAAAPPSAAEVTVLKQELAIQSGFVAAGMQSVGQLVGAFELPPDSPQHAVVDAVMPDAGKVSTICHGSVMDVPRREQALGSAAIGDDAVFCYPNVQRALAEVAGKTGSDDIATDHLDMMLGQLGQQSGSTSGVVDLPGAQHARIFQSVPGRSRWYARLEIRPQPITSVGQFVLADLDEGAVSPAYGHWPLQQRRSAMHQIQYAQLETTIPPTLLNQPPAQPAGPTDAEIVAWIGLLRAAFAAAAQQSAAAGRPLEPRLIRVQDHRKHAQPTPQGRSTDGSGPAQAGWWVDLGEPTDPIDIQDDPLHAMLAELRRSIGGARIHLPDPDNLFEVPGPRWYRPWAPHLVIYGAGRSYRHGADGRFRADGHLLTRVSGEVMTGLKVGGHTVLATDLVEGGASLNVTGVPAVAGGLVAEHALADADNAAVMARTAHRTGGGTGELSVKQTSAASRALWLGRGKIIDQQQKDVIAAIEPVGTAPSAAGLQDWRAWYGPLFLDSMYTHRRKRFNDAWQLPPEYIECVDRNPVVLPDRQQVITERQIATVTVANVLKQNLALELGQDRFGNPKPKKPAPDGLDADSFEQLDIVSASLGHLDEALFGDGEREQGGFVHLGKIDLYDTFGRPLTWSSDESGLDPLPPWATALPARLASWGRLGFRLQAAADPDVDAAPLTPPVCGILLPDFVDQSLEVYDANGLAVGQVSADDPVVMNPGGPRVLNVNFTPLPWVADALAPGAESTDAITNPTLRRLVQALVAQPVAVPGGASGWFETGFTAMLRVFDTIRSTLDPGFVRGDSRVRLLGEPIVVMNVRLSFEVSAGSIADLRAEPPLLTDPPALPVLRVRVGDVTRPDDGVLGCFLIGASPADDRFAPTSAEAAEKAVVNTMTSLAGSQKTQPISHPFIEAQVAEFDLAAGSPIDTVVLADARGSLYATCGMLPRKTVILPKDFIDPSLKLLEPTFRVGPILGFDQGGTLVPQLPAPTIEGMTATFVHDDDASYPELAVPPVLGVGELPPRRVRLTEGWARMSRQAPPA